MKTNSKAVEFIYQDTQIHFLLSNDDNVMVNATEMAKAFNKRTSDFLQNQATKDYISEIELTLKSVNSEYKIYENRGQSGMYFERRLALKFATWLDVKFEFWVFDTIDKILFGHYKQHWDAHIKQENAKLKMEKAKNNLLIEANQEDVIAYFEAEKEYKSAKSEKINAIQSQYKLFL
jgi:hypothetical protein